MQHNPYPPPRSDHHSECIGEYQRFCLCIVYINTNMQWGEKSQQLNSIIAIHFNDGHTLDSLRFWQCAFLTHKPFEVQKRSNE